MSFKDEDGRECHRQYYATTVEIQDFNVVINARTFLNQPIKIDLKTYDHIRKIATGEVMITELDAYQIISISKATMY